MNYSLDNLYPNWAICSSLKKGQNFSGKGQKIIHSGGDFAGQRLRLSGTTAETVGDSGMQIVQGQRQAQGTEAPRCQGAPFGQRGEARGPAQRLCMPRPTLMGSAKQTRCCMRSALSFLPNPVMFWMKRGGGYARSPRGAGRGVCAGGIWGRRQCGFVVEGKEVT